MKKFTTMLMSLFYSIALKAQDTTQIAENSSSSGELLILLWIAFAIVLFVCARQRNKYEILTGTMYYVRWITFLLLCVLELIFIPPLLTPSTEYAEGFIIITLLLSIPFGITALLQLKTFCDILEDYKVYYGTKYRVYWGPITLFVGAILTFVGGICEAKIIFGVSLISTIISQIVYILILFVKVLKSQNIITALMCVVTYVLGLASIALISAFVLIGWLIFKVCKFSWGVMTPPPPPPTNTYPNYH